MKKALPIYILSKKSENAELSLSSMFLSLCIFCNSQKKKTKSGTVEYLRSCEILEAGQKIQEAAKLLGNKDVLSKINGVDLVAKEAKY